MKGTVLLSKGFLVFFLIAGIVISPAYSKSVQLDHWKELINFHPTETDMGTKRAARGQALVKMKVQRIEAARGSLVNFDEFSVTITKAPTSGPKTAEELMLYVRTHLNEFVDTAYGSFSLYDTNEKPDWERAGGAPLGSVMVISIPIPPKHPLLSKLPFKEKAAMVTSKSSSTSWVFSPVRISVANPGEHPVSGNREFGFRTVEGGLGQIYTRGVDRAIGGYSDPTQTYIFEGADALWKSFQKRVKSFIEKNGGEAKINSPIVERPEWVSQEVAQVLGKSVADLRVELSLSRKLYDRMTNREKATEAEKGTWPLVLKKRAWEYLVNAVNLACSDPQYFSQKYKGEHLPGVLLSQNDFDAFYAKDLVRRESFLDMLKLRRQPPLSECQKFILGKMQREGQPVTVDWITSQSRQYRKDNPTLVQSIVGIPGAIASAINQIFKELDAAIPATPSGGSSNSGTHVPVDPVDKPAPDGRLERRGFKGDIPGLKRPDFDLGPGSTLGR